MPESDSTPETWKPVKGYKCLYDVSNCGSLRSYYRLERQRDGTVKSVVYDSPVVINPAKTRNGYLIAHLFKNGRRETFMVHRLVARAFIGPCPLGMTVNHINCIRSDNRAENLNYMTRTEQNNWSVSKGRWNTGNRATPGRQRWHKFNREQILAARILSREGWSQCEISKAVHISQQYISVILRQLKWKNLERIPHDPIP